MAMVESDHRATSDPEARRTVLKRVADENVEYVLLWFTDLEGHLKSFAITPKEMEGALDDEEAERVARGVGESALVRTAVYGRDANWGRVNQAVGQALARTGGHVDFTLRFDGAADLKVSPASAGVCFLRR